MSAAARRHGFAAWLSPGASLVQGPDGTLYGTADAGEGFVKGTVFKLNSDGTGFTVLKWLTHSMEGADPAGSLQWTNATVLRVNTDGSGTVLFNVTIVPGAPPRFYRLSMP